MRKSSVALSLFAGALLDCRLRAAAIRRRRLSEQARSIGGSVRAGCIDGHPRAARRRRACPSAWARRSSSRTSAAPAARSARRRWIKSKAGRLYDRRRDAGPITISPVAQKDMPYDVAELQAITMIAGGPGALVVPKNSPYKTLQELIAAAKAKPGSMSFGTAGVGAFSHLEQRALQNAGRDRRRPRSIQGIGSRAARPARRPLGLLHGIFSGACRNISTPAKCACWR